MKIGYRAQHLKKRTRPRYRTAVLGVFVLLIAIMVSMSVSLAKMLSTASGSDNARVAAFIVDANGQEDTRLRIDIPDGILTQEYAIKVTNQNANGKTAEVALSYDVVLTLPQALPAGVSLILDGTTGTPSGDSKTVTFENMGTFMPGTAETKTHTLTFTVTDADLITQNHQLLGISVDVRAEQID